LFVQPVRAISLSKVRMSSFGNYTLYFLCEIWVLTPVLFKIQVYWDMTPCWLVNCYWHFKAPYCLQPQDVCNPRRVTAEILNMKTKNSSKLVVTFYLSKQYYIPCDFKSWTRFIRHKFAQLAVLLPTTYKHPGEVSHTQRSRPRQPLKRRPHSSSQQDIRGHPENTTPTNKPFGTGKTPAPNLTGNGNQKNPAAHTMQ
jgi:hypothetical protein